VSNATTCNSSGSGIAAAEAAIQPRRQPESAADSIVPSMILLWLDIGRWMIADAWFASGTV
jgi:hypothetical protein